MTENAARANDRSSSGDSLTTLLATLLGLVPIILLLGWVFNQAMTRTGGEFTYPLDDSYIHLALAKNLAAHGVWGATRYEAAAASSSPLWTAILALCFKIVGNNILVPVTLNFILAIATFLTVMKFASRWIKNVWARSGIALFVLLALPVSVLVFNGMEHMLQVLLTLLFLDTLLTSLESNEHKAYFWRFFILGFLMTLTRYESLFLFVVPVLLAWRKKRFELVAPMLGGITGVAFFGAISVSMGLPILPNPLLLKSDYSSTGVERITALVERFSQNFMFLLPLNIALVIASIAALIWAKRFRPALLTMLVAVLLHYSFADVRWGFFRYEAYLIGGLLFLILLILGTNRSRTPIVVMAATVLFVAYRLFYRVMLGTLMMPIGMQNIHDQQFQMAKFIGTYYPNGRVAVIDVGAVSYYTDAHIIDLCGLASNDVRELWVEHKWNQEAIDKILRARSADFAIIHAYFFRRIGGLPPYMEPVVGWKIPDNVTCGADTVTFYTPEWNRRQLVQSIQNFEPQLPKEVQVVPPER